MCPTVYTIISAGFSPFTRIKKKQIKATSRISTPPPQFSTKIGSTGMGSNGILTESTLKYCNKNYPDVVTKGKEETKEG